jgi:hypothetical protein
MPLIDWDTSMPAEIAERRLNVKRGRYTLDELAERMSNQNPDEPISVREHRDRPIRHSRVFKAGKPTGATPYFVAKGIA